MPLRCLSVLKDFNVLNAVQPIALILHDGVSGRFFISSSLGEG